MAAETERLSAMIEADPAEALKVLRELHQYVVQPHPGQKKVLDSEARFSVLNAGRRWGKTKLGAKKALAVTRKQNKMVWWVAPTYGVVKRGYREVLRQLPRGVLEHTPPPDTNFDAGRKVVLRFKNDTRMEFYSAERPEGMLGEGVDFAVLDEAAIMPSRIWNQIVSPTLMDHKGGGLFISTPRGRNWFYKAWLKGQDEQDSDWESWTFPSNTNPHLPPEEFHRMKRDLPHLEFQQEVMAAFIAAGSSVFLVPESSVQQAQVFDNGMVEGYAPKGHVVLGIDLAKTTDWTVLYGARARDRRNCYYGRFHDVTWGEQKRRIRRAVKQLKEAGATGVTMVVDSTGVGDPVAEDLESLGYDVVPINFTTHKNNMVKLLAKDLEEAKAFVLDNQQREEFDNYLMSMTPSGKYSYSAPEGEHDDAVSAKMLQHWGLINEGVPEVQVISADSEPITFPSRPEDEEFGEDETWDDLYDGPLDALDDEEDAMEAIGVSTKIPTPEELMANPDVWF